MDSLPVNRYIIAGQLRREYIISPKGKASVDIPGGNCLYSASGLAVWDQGIALIGKVGADYPNEFLDQIARHEFDTRGIQVDSEELDLRSFYGYNPDSSKPDTTNPVSFFANLGFEFPKSLLGFTASAQTQDTSTNPKQITPYTINISKIPEDYWDISAAHICPLDYQSHQFIASMLRQAHFNHITMDLSNEIMSPAFWDEIPGMINGATALLTTENKVLSLFQGRSKDLWEIAETLSSHGCEIIVIKRGMQGQIIFDYTGNKRWIIPAYPSTSADPTGAGAAFDGGFLAGFRNTYDPLEAALQGNISASLTVEGSGAFYALDALPGLNQARLENLRSMVRKQ